jgi:hypothetical protein
MVVVPARQATQAGGIDSLESILGLHKKFKNSGSVKEPRNRFPAWEARRTTLFDLPARQST